MGGTSEPTFWTSGDCISLGCMAQNFTWICLRMLAAFKIEVLNIMLCRESAIGDTVGMLCGPQ
jgi:hypothetical protein